MDFLKYSGQFGLIILQEKIIILICLDIEFALTNCDGVIFRAAISN